MVVKFVFAGDPMTYFNRAMHPEHYPSEAFFSSGVPFISSIARLFAPFTSLFPDPFLMLFIPFSLMAFIGSLFFIKILRQMNIRTGKPAYFFAFFMPNLVFWTCILGKDSLVYFSMMGFFSSLLSLRKRMTRASILGLVFFSAMIYFPRPHILVVVLAALMLGQFFEGKKFTVFNMLIIGVALLGLVFIVNRAASHVGLTAEDESVTDVLSADKAKERLDQIAGAVTSEEGGSNIDLGTVTWAKAPLYALFWLTVPYPWHIKKAIHLFGFLDATIIQLTLLYIFLHWKKLLRTSELPYKKFMFFMILMSASVFGMAQSNFGLIVRQRIMVLPFIFIFFLFLIQKKPQMPLKTSTERQHGRRQFHRHV